MERSLLWICFALGFIGYLCGYQFSLRKREEGESCERLSASPLWLAALLTAALFILTSLLSRPPFSPGHVLGEGYLIGAVGAALAAIVAFRIRPGGQSAILSAAAITAPWFIASLACAGLLLFRRDVITYELMFYAIGWFVTSWLIRVSMPTSEENSTLQPDFAALISYPLILAITCVLGIYRGSTNLEENRLSALAATVGCGVPLLLLLTSAITARINSSALRKFLRAFLCYGLIAGLIAMLSLRLTGSYKLLAPALVGLSAGTLLWWLLAEHARSERGGLPGALVIAILVVPAAYMLSYHFMAGYGVGIMLLCMWVPAALSLFARYERSADNINEMSSSAFGPLLVFGTLLLLVRLLAVRVSIDSYNLDIEDHFTLFGLLTGALLPLWLVELFRNRLPLRGANGWLRALFAGLISLAVPFLVIRLLDGAIIAPMMLGITLCTAIQIILPSTKIDDRLGGYFALGIGLALCQWTERITALHSLARIEKVHMAFWIAVTVAICLLIFEAWRRLRPTADPDVNIQEGIKR